MEPLIAVLLMFGLGMAAEAYRILIWRRMKKTDYLALTGFLALAAVYSPLLAEGKLTGSYIYDGFVIFYFVFPAFYLMYFKKMILPAIDERVLLVWNILFTRRHLFLESWDFGRPRSRHFLSGQSLFRW